jgi:hypothetical protein
MDVRAILDLAPETFFVDLAKRIHRIAVLRVALQNGMAVGTHDPANVRIMCPGFKNMRAKWTLAFGPGAPCDKDRAVQGDLPRRRYCTPLP